MHVKPVSAILLGAAACIAGCSVGPNYRPPAVDVPSAFDISPETQPATRGASTQPAVDITRWWQSLGDPELNTLIARAVASNLDLAQALARVQEARSSEAVTAGGVLPFVEASGALAKGTGTNSTKGRVSSPLNAGTNTTGLHEITQVVGFDAGWEIDLWGKFRRELEAAAADTQAAVEARNDVLVTLVSDVARAYIDVRTAQLRLAIATQNISTADQSLNLVQQRFNRGLTNELDVALARRLAATERATVAPLQFSITQAQRRLAVLLGQSPESLHDELAASQPLPRPPVDLVTGVPIDALQRRPDIREAERRLAAENARIGVATADLFPRIAVTGGFGLQGQGLTQQPYTDSFIWSAGPTAILPIFDFGRIDSMIELENFRTQELFYRYKKQVLTAIEEVDDAAGNYNAQQDRLTHLREALDASQRAVTLASGRYERGLIDFLNVLDAQRQLYELQDEYTLAEQTTVDQYIAVYKSLGGGWQPYQELPAIRQPQPAVFAAIAHAVKPDVPPYPTQQGTP
jgi:NodT family efflux transporter outer membrane factor (OMF) lipoprotein